MLEATGGLCSGVLKKNTSVTLIPFGMVYVEVFFISDMETGLNNKLERRPKNPTIPQWFRFVPFPFLLSMCSK